jgi:hypothetical protein
MLTRYLYMVFGDGDEHYAQAHLSALTVMSHAPAPWEVVLATDRPGRFSWLGQAEHCRVVALDAATLARWRGAHDFFWRVKLECIQAHLDPALAVVYLDSDTYARRDLAALVMSLQDGAVMMHEPEQVLATSSRSGDRKFYRSLGGATPQGLVIDRGTRMWNAGVVAIGPGGAGLLARAIAICDELCARIGNHSLNEQLALTLSLAASGRLIPAQPWIDHYWGNKRDHLPAINALLTRLFVSGMSPREAAAEAGAHPILLPLHVRRRRWQQWLGRRLHLQ